MLLFVRQQNVEEKKIESSDPKKIELSEGHFEGCFFS